MRERLVRPRTTAPGETIALLVLAAGRRSCVGVDLASGALVRTHQREREPARLRPFVVAEGVVDAPRRERPDQPEALDLVDRLRPVGMLRGRPADRYLRPLLHPRHQPLLGFPGSSTPWWLLDGSRPSVALVAPDSGPVVHVDGRGVRVRFTWDGRPHDLPLEDHRVLSRLDWTPPSPLQGAALAALLGGTPDRLVVALGRPVAGHSRKVVAALLPRP